MDENVLNSYIRAGRIAAEIRMEAEKVVTEGVKVFNICERLETLISNKGGRSAFPCNVCINDVAAHDTAAVDDPRVIPWGSVVKVDIGVHVDGYIADTATTIVFNEKFEALKYAVEDALEKAVKAISPGVHVGQIGDIIEPTVKKHGFKPIWNLSGHEVKRYTIHAGVSIPNVSGQNGNRFQVDGVYAVEPFATLNEASGQVIGLSDTRIYRCTQYRKQRSVDHDLLLRKLWDERRGLPFAERWFRGYKPSLRFGNAWDVLKASKFIRGYQVLRERSGCVVTQAEHTVLITKDDRAVLT